MAGGSPPPQLRMNFQAPHRTWCHAYCRRQENFFFSLSIRLAPSQVFGLLFLVHLASPLIFQRSHTFFFWDSYRPLSSLCSPTLKEIMQIGMPTAAPLFFFLLSLPLVYESVPFESILLGLPLYAVVSLSPARRASSTYLCHLDLLFALYSPHVFWFLLSLTSPTQPPPFIESVISIPDRLRAFSYRVATPGFDTVHSALQPKDPDKVSLFQPIYKFHYFPPQSSPVHFTPVVVSRSLPSSYTDQGAHSAKYYKIFFLSFSL